MTSQEHMASGLVHNADDCSLIDLEVKGDERFSDDLDHMAAV